MWQSKFVRSMSAVVAGTMMVFGATAQDSNDKELAAFKQAIRVKYDMKEKAFHERDAETIVTKFYAEDAIEIGEGQPPHRGREELRKLYHTPGALDNEVRFVSFYTHVNGNVGWDWADFTVTPAGQKEKPVTYKYKIIFVWERLTESGGARPPHT